MSVYLGCIPLPLICKQTSLSLCGDQGMEILHPPLFSALLLSFISLSFSPCLSVLSLNHSQWLWTWDSPSAGTDGKSIEASDLYYGLLYQLPVCLKWEQNIKDRVCAVSMYLCVCVCVCFLRGVCNRDQEKVNYLLVLRCRLASPGWAGSSGEREREREAEGGKEREGRKRREIPG